MLISGKLDISRDANKRVFLRNKLYSANLLYTTHFLLDILSGTYSHLQYKKLNLPDPDSNTYLLIIVASIIKLYSGPSQHLTHDRIMARLLNHIMALLLVSSLTLALPTSDLSSTTDLTTSSNISSPPPTTLQSSSYVCSEGCRRPCFDLKYCSSCDYLTGYEYVSPHLTAHICPNTSRL